MHDLGGDASPDAAVVLAAHGITANGYWWLPLARRLRQRGSPVRLLAACLRGRADSAAVGEPYGLVQHADDLGLVAARLGVRPVLLGHSMGGFVAALALARHPGSFTAGLLVDGGVSVPVPDGVDPMTIARPLLRPMLVRLGMRFPDQDAYVTSWARHPALRPLMQRDGDLLRRVALHDAVPMVGEAPPGPVGVRQSGVRQSGVRQGVARRAVLQDGRDVATDPQVAAAPAQAAARGMPMELVWARRGPFDEPRGFYDEQLLAPLVPAGMRSTCVEGANHLSVVLAQPGTDVIVDALERLLAA